MENQTPKVSVFMPVYNAGNFLHEAIESILCQTFKDFEFLIVNDGSSDQSESIIRSYNDERIKLINNPKNLGLIASLNIGLDLCQGEYIVRMDQDDISMPERIAHQIEFMDRNPQFGLIGSWFEDFGEHIESKEVRYSTDDIEIRLRHLYQTHISHPTAVIRNSIIRKFKIQFDPDFIHGEDYNCWVTISQFCKLSNFPEVLVRKRDHPTNITNKYFETMNSTCNRVKCRLFQKMGVSITSKEADLYSRFCNPEWYFSFTEFSELKDFLNRLAYCNPEEISIPKKALLSYLALRWFHLCYNSKAQYISSIKTWKSLPYHNLFKPSRKQMLKFQLRSFRLPI
jgi:glycosyltransferase involved in cell wall biosynthesis